MNHNENIISLEKAYEIALAAHSGQTRKFASDEDYIHHPVRVMLKLSSKGKSPSVQAMGLLHDTIEDSNGEELMLEANFPVEFVEKIKALSKPDGMGKSDEDYLSWIQSMDDEDVIAVKMADLEDNMVWRGENEPPEKWQKLRKRYRRAWDILDDKVEKL